MRNRIRTCVWYSLIWSPSTVAEVSSTSMPSTPRSVLPASASACAAASRQDSVDTPTRSIVLMTAISPPSVSRSARTLAPGARGVHVDHPPVVLADRLRGRLAGGLAIQVGLQRVPPDGPPDGEPDVPGHAG